VACDERGDRLTSAQFATLLADARDHAQDVAFVIGGAFGLPDAVRERATRTIQMAPWTLPHELARLVLAEQLYRAGTIARGEPYHK
jgi:23S rRNA (pseudouridine1915-N3)-methyltransferase